MRKAVLFVALVAVSLTIAAPPPPTKVLTYPTALSVAELDAARLQLAWKQQLPVLTAQNGIGTVQFIDGMLFVLLRDGTIVAMDAESGRIIWSHRVCNSYPVIRRFGFGSGLLLVLDDNRLFALDAKTGSQRWALELPDVPVTPPMAGEYLLYATFSNGRVITYALPETTVKALQLDHKQRSKFAEKVSQLRAKITEVAPLVPTGVNLLDPRAAGAGGRSVTIGGLKDRTSSGELTNARSATTSMALHRSASYVTKPATATELKNAASAPLYLSSRSPGFRVDDPVLVSQIGILVSGRGPTIVAFRRDAINLTYTFTAASPLALAPTQYGDNAYFSCQDGSLYSINLAQGKLNWKIVAPGPMTEAMIVTHDAIYGTVRDSGLLKFDRQSGNLLWAQSQGQTALAANESFAYAKDRTGSLLVLDSRTGLVVGKLNLSDFNVHLVNQHTDRIILAANDGSMICLHDAYQTKSLTHGIAIPPAPLVKLDAAK